jgi:hypothetical protein
VGEITNIVRRYVPATYRAMVEATSPTSRLFTTGDLQALAEYVKYRLYGTGAHNESQETQYNPQVRQFLGKLTTLQFIPPAIDYWDSQLASKVTTGTQESLSYRDHLEGLKMLYDRLTKEVAEEFLELAPGEGFTIHSRSLLPRVTYGDNGRGIMVTPDPMDMEGPFDTHRPFYLPWKVNI